MKLLEKMTKKIIFTITALNQGDECNKEKYFHGCENPFQFQKKHGVLTSAQLLT